MKNLEQLPTKIRDARSTKLLTNCGKLYLSAPIKSIDRNFYKFLFKKIKSRFYN